MRKRPREVSLDEVRITRRGDTAEFDYADDAMGSMSLTLGVDVTAMSDVELLEKHNEVVRRMEAVAASYEHVATEVPVGSPQLRYSAAADQWVPRGQVLRCVIHDGGPDGEATVEVDGRELSLRDFGRMLTVHAGWGMRIVFVPDDELHLPPAIEVREPEDAAPPPRKARKPKPAKRDAVTDRMPIYQLRVTLVGTEPPVWRRVLVSGNLSLGKLHHVIQAAMGWTNSHLHVFTHPGGAAYADPRFELDETRDESRTKLRTVAKGAGSRLSYEYDLGDSWLHDIVVEDILPPAGAGRTPRCVGGERACPPEDCGGIGGHENLVAAMKDPRHPDRKDLLAWLGQEFDPEAFDLDEANRRIRSVK